MAEPLARWLVLIHQIPPTPSYLRVKIGRRLQGLGAVAVKNSVYVLPRTDEALEDFQWVRGEIVGGGGEASVCEARFVEGLSDRAIEGLFNTAREADYAALAREARALQSAATRRRPPKAGDPDKLAASLLRLRKRLAEVVELDFFSANGRDAVEDPLSAVEAVLRPAPALSSLGVSMSETAFTNATRSFSSASSTRPRQAGIWMTARSRSFHCAGSSRMRLGAPSRIHSRSSASSFAYIVTRPPAKGGISSRP